MRVCWNLSRKAAFAFLLLCLVAFVGGAVPSHAHGASNELYLQAVDAGLGQNGIYYMDVTKPTGSSEVTGPASFVTRPLAANSDYDDFEIKLYLKSDYAYYTLHIELGRYAPSVGFTRMWTTNVTIPVFTTFLDRELTSGLNPPISIGTGERLELVLNSDHLSFGDQAKPSSLITNQTEYGGVPVPEFPFSESLVLIIMVVVSVGLLKRVRVVPK